MSENEQALRCHIDVIVEDPAWHKHLPNLEEITPLLCRACLAMAPLAEGKIGPMELCVVLANDDRLRHMNDQYRGVDRPTNVLSFANLDGALMPKGPGPLMLGDVLLSRETTAREAAEQDKSFADHASHLIVHGTLHLLGYRHEEDEDAEAMESLERRILTQFSIADPYRGRLAAGGQAAEDQATSAGSDQSLADAR